MITVVLAAALLSAAAVEDYAEAPFQGWAQHEERGSTRLIYFSKTADRPWNYSPGQVAIEYGKPVWKEEYEQGFDDLTRGKRWRMGQNYWSNLDTRFPVTIGGTHVERGIYYVVLERFEDDRWRLVLLNPDTSSDRKFDAWHVNRKETASGVEAPLEWERVQEKADHLQIRFLMDEADHRKAELEIRFGPHKLTAPVRVLFEVRQVEAG